MSRSQPFVSNTPPISRNRVVIGEDGVIGSPILDINTICIDGQIIQIHAGNAWITYNGEDIVSIVNMTDNLEDFPLIMHPQLTINSDSLATLLTSVVMAANTKLEEDLGLISNATNTILLAVSDKVTATDTILKRNGITIKL